MQKFISNTKYYDFKDILILPQSSSINSRNDVNLTTTFSFNNNLTWTGIPIIASNMTTIGTLQVYKTLSKYKILDLKGHRKDIKMYNKLNIKKVNENKSFIEDLLDSLFGKS